MVRCEVCKRGIVEAAPLQYCGQPDGYKNLCHDCKTRIRGAARVSAMNYINRARAAVQEGIDAGTAKQVHRFLELIADNLKIASFIPRGDETDEGVHRDRHGERGVRA